MHGMAARYTRCLEEFCEVTPNFIDQPFWRNWPRLLHLQVTPID
jgi:hypothetical protein